MLLSGMIWGIAHGAVDGMTQSLLDSAKEAVTLGFTMLGVMSFWCGIMEVGKRAGLMDKENESAVRFSISGAFP